MCIYILKMSGRRYTNIVYLWVVGLWVIFTPFTLFSIF